MAVYLHTDVLQQSRTIPATHNQLLSKLGNVVASYLTTFSFVETGMITRSFRAIVVCVSEISTSSLNGNSRCLAIDKALTCL